MFFFFFFFFFFFVFFFFFFFFLFSKYKCLIVDLFFPPWFSEWGFLVAHFLDHCLLVPLHYEAPVLIYLGAIYLKNWVTSFGTQ